jgi:hypothetical protein
MNPKNFFMKRKISYFFIGLLCAAVLSCSKDDEVKKKGDADLPHEGTKWNITSVDTYTLSDVGMTGVISKTGSASNAGAFYFVDGESKGSFEMTIEGYNKEDVFDYDIDENGGITITEISQSVGVTTNQNVLVITGEKTSDTEITLSTFSITKQSSATGIFQLTAITVKLVKA